MFPFLAIFIVFCLILNYYIHKNDTAQQKVQDEFWEKELRSNAIRKKDISKLDYITIPLNKIPVKLCTSTETKLYAIAEKPILNLNGISNTDLKLQYGTANLEILSEYDTNFLDFVSLVPDYATELVEAGEKESAIMLLEFAVSVNADSKKINRLLANLKEESSSVN